MEASKFDAPPAGGYAQAEVLRSMASESALLNERRVYTMADQYRALAADVFRTIHDISAGEGKALAVAYQVAAANYATEDAEENPWLRGFADVLLRSPRAWHRSQEISSMRRELADENRQHSEAEQSAYHDKVASLVQYRHQVRRVLLAGSDELTFEEVADWFGQASRHDNWARRDLLPRVAAEIATYKFFKERLGQEGIEKVRFGSVEEDDKDGCDIVVGLAGGREVSVDVKYAGQAPEGFVRMSHGGVVQFGVPAEVLQDFSLAPAAGDEFLAKFWDEVEDTSNRLVHTSGKA